MADRVEVRTDDPAQAAAAYEAAFPGLRVATAGLEHQPFAFDYRAVRGPRLALHRMRCSGSARASGPLPEAVSIGRHLAGGMRITRAGRAVDTSTPFLRPIQPAEMLIEDASVMLLTVDPGSLADYADRVELRAPLAGRTPLPPAMTALGLVMDRTAVLADEADALDVPAVADELFDVACWTLLRAYQDPWAETSRGNGGAPALRRALAHLDEHATGTVTIADVAAAARVSTRSLHLLFRRELDTTPHRYLRDLRLDRARLDLLRGDDGVADIARRNGFGHTGRFAADYRDRFGEPPATTRRAARP